MNNREKFSEIYEEERNKLSGLPDIEEDFIAYEKALLRFSKENI